MEIGEKGAEEVTFRTIVCGTDTSPQSLEAARRALVLGDEGVA